ncbi:lysine--tRNA ligase [Entomobacter blattae]|uniref:Lysine--tRNA ligase n=1 Tax=Entomobacter blattae TaxID=2762277 RepID=A0A7H1NRX6_9PROT|nr:lysine--tRNA ligase [Entomobacter blattae]QNT78536.1 Lysine--tRNA ligase [Entomobacter blattae]
MTDLPPFLITPRPKIWPFEEAEKIAAYLKQNGKEDPSKPVLMETGYGPSGLPHIGTFGEVARTSWVRQAFTALTGRPTRLLAFSDDMDGLRKVPDNVPNQEMLRQHLGHPLSRIPDPFGKYDSFSAHNNAMLRSFLDSFGFEYEFASSSQYYTEGRFDAALKRVLEVHEAIVKAVLPTLGPERKATYSPILPIHPETGVVMQVKMEKVDPVAGTVAWRDESGKLFETEVTAGRAKLQWKADWAMRWYALGVDYEMSGKDLIESVKLSGKICKILGAQPPQGLTYELFLDEKGQKISKSKGNGLSVEEWLRYAPAESLAQYMFNAPQRAKRLYFDVIPKATDEYYSHAETLRRTSQEEAEGEVQRYTNPAWFIDKGQIPTQLKTPVSFAMLLNLVSAANAENADILWGFLKRYDPTLTPEAYPEVSRLIEYALIYYADFVKAYKEFRAPTDQERNALHALAQGLASLDETKRQEGEALQNLVFEIGKTYEFTPLRAWFSCLYEVLLGQKEGPRFGSFVALYGIDATIGLIKSALERK